MLSPEESEEIDRMVIHLRGAVQQFGNFRADLGSTAVVVFAEHFARAVISQAPVEKRQEAAERFSAALAAVGENIEMWAAAISDNTGLVH